MRPYIDTMRKNIADALSIDIEQVNVKATTEEGMGFTGSGEGISAQAICLLNSPREFATIDVNDFGKEECIFANNYKWLEIYPDNEKYAITVMYDNNNNLIEWYFDMIKSGGTENGIPYINDLYLDYVIKEDGKEVILDENDFVDLDFKNV